ncbi:hypothetical protein [Cupriavidus sp. YAF13]|uniref:hypothetical protein n=1 Tax=Cupriavidus sp. YAF13 TaxID=3233075 RepID=UPI003F8DE44D
MPYVLRTVLCLLALSAALVSPFAAGNDAIAVDGGTSTATSTQVVANGDDDRMVPTSNSYDLAKLLPNNRLVIDPDPGHGGVLQYQEDTPCAKRCHFSGSESARFP